MSYAPLNFESNDLGEIVRWLNTELRLIADELKKRELVVYNVAPTERFYGQIVIADGTNWNPGSGHGLYWWNGTAWTFLG